MHLLWPQCYETRNQSQEENWKRHKDMEAKWHVLKQRMGQQLDQGRNQKIPWNKWKWEHNSLKSMGHRESNLQREIHSITVLSREIRKSSNKQSSFTLKGTWKRKTNKA